MATRFYLSTTNASLNIGGPLSGGGIWESSGQTIVTKRIGTVKRNTAVTVNALVVGNGTNPNDVLYYQGISDALRAQTISGTVIGSIAARENTSINTNAFTQLGVFVVNAAGTRVATLIGQQTTGGTEFNNPSANNRIMPRGGSASVTSYDCAYGDRIVVEVGVRIESTRTTDTVSLWIGDDGSTDLPNTDAGSNSLVANPWIEFSGTILLGNAGTFTLDAVKKKTGTSATFTLDATIVRHTRHRFYLTRTTAADVAAVVNELSFWNLAPGANQRKLAWDTTGLAETTSLSTAAVGSGANPNYLLIRSWVSDPISFTRDQNGRDTISGVIQVREANAAVNAAMQVVVKLVSNDGQTVLDYLYSTIINSVGTHEWDTVRTNRLIPFGGEIAADGLVNAEGARLMIELGAAINSTDTTNGVQIASGTNSGATDLVANETDTADGNAWFELYMWDSRIGLWKSGTFTADAIVSKPRSGSFSVNAVISKPQSATFTANAVVLGTRSGSFSANAIARVPRSGTWTIDATLRLGVQTTLASFTCDAILLRSQTGSATADAVLLQGRTSAFNIGAVQRSPRQGSWAIDAAVLTPIARSLALDAVLGGTQARTFSIDAVRLVARASDAHLDATIRASRAGTFSLDAALIRRSSASFVLGAVVLVQPQRSFVAEALTQKLFQGELLVSAILLAAHVGSFEANSVLHRSQGTSFAADAITLRQTTQAVHISSTLRGEVRASFTAAAWVVPPVGHFTVDAVRRVQRAGSVALDAVLGFASLPPIDADVTIRMLGAAVTVRSLAATVSMHHLEATTWIETSSIDAVTSIQRLEADTDA